MPWTGMIGGGERSKCSTLTFKGKTTFGSGVQWDGPLISISGQGIHVYGASGSVLDGQGPHYWDGKGGSGTRKPRFIKINANGGSTFQGIHLLNCPINCVSLSGSKDMTIRGWNIDCSAGDKNALGHNTDGFDMSSVENIIIENSVVKNQDDCVAVNYGKNLHISNLNCSGGHGLSLSVGMNKIDPSVNVVSNVTFTDCSVTHSRNGIHVKTHRDGTTGYISDVTYNNIHLSSISYYGVNVQQDYQDGGSTGHAGNNIQIKNLNLHNVQGTMTGSSSMPVYILCGSGSCSNFNWNEVSITGNKKHSSCNYHPNGYTCK
ncbi:polygalacturonase-like isoform X2 [Diabrotica undecimpunctata]|uniref:polygalacturonase-like isoform X2 n=1 Tax=Diabrotica undecimpunctata TaxID=50387 RepID=UPI003B632666